MNMRLSRTDTTGEPPRRGLGRPFAWMWSAYAVSSFGTSLAFGAFPIIAILVLHSDATEVSILAAVGLAAGAAAAAPLGPWVELRRKRPVMIAMDLTRFAASMSIPLAFALGRLGFAQLLLVAVVVAAADIAFKAASGAFLKTLVEPDDLLAANSHLEVATWTTITLGPPIGGALIGAFGPVTTVIADAVSYVLSAVGLTAIGRGEPRPEPAPRRGSRAAELVEGWRCILAHTTLRRLFFSDVLFRGLLLATEPLLSVLMLSRLGFPAWQYGLALASPCIGGLIGSRSARRLVARFGQRRVMLASGTLRVIWPIGLAFIPSGLAGLALVFGLQLCLVTCIGVFAPIFATYRLEQTDKSVVARVLSAWSVTSNATVAVLTVTWGLLATATGPRIAIALAGALLLATPVVSVARGSTTARSVPPAGLEPATPGLEGRCSIQLSYGGEACRAPHPSRARTRADASWHELRHG
jgi:MFS family permease